MKQAYNMHSFKQISVALVVLGTLIVPGGTPATSAPATPFLQLALAGPDGNLTENDLLKMAALEGLMAAPPEKALPLLKKVLAGNHDDTIKSRALFVLGQIELPEAQALLLEHARSANSMLQTEAIRAIGISGDRDSLAQLASIYRDGDDRVREGILEAYLIADDAAAVYAIAKEAKDDREFERAVTMLGVMGATRELGLLADSGNTSTSLIQAYAVSGDLENLKKMAAAASDAEQRAAALSGMGMIGSEEANAALMDAYREAPDKATRQAALQGLLIGDHDEGVLELFRASRDSAEKRLLLRTMMNMDSDLVLDVIDSTLEED